MKKWRRKPWSLLLAGAFFCSMSSVGAAADLSLAGAVELALSQNADLKITKQAEEAALASLGEAKSEKGFSVSASGGYSVGRNWKDRGNTTSSGLNASVKSGVNIWDGGKASGGIDSAKIAILTARLKTARAEEKLRLSVIEAYYNALQAKKTVGVNKASVDNYQAHLTNVEQLFSAGSKARMDVLRASVELSDARQTLIKAENEYEISLAKLRNLVNMDRDEPLRLTDDAVYSPFAPALSDCLAFGVENRKELWIDNYDVVRKELDIEVVKAGYTPQIDFSLSASADKDFEPASASGRGVTAGINMNWNIFDGGRKKARIEAAEAALDAARLQLEKDRNDVDYDIRAAYFSMKEAENRLNSTQDAVDKAKEDYFIAREKYRAGEGIMLDVIDAQLALSKAEMNHISAQYDFARGKAQVENAMGQSLTESEQRAADAMDAVPLARAEISRRDAVHAYEENEKAMKERQDRTVIPFPASEAAAAKQSAVQKERAAGAKASNTMNTANAASAANATNAADTDSAANAAAAAAGNGGRA